MKYLCVLIFFILSNISLAQEYRISASPMCGWDSLKSRIIYPVTMRRASIEEKVTIKLSIDTTGAINNISFQRGDDGGINNIAVQWANERSDTVSNIFEEIVLEVIRSTSWIPAKYQGRSLCDEITIKVDFIILTDNYKHFLIANEP